MTKGETDRLSVDAMLDYFQPLFNWLQDQNKNEKVVGWTTFKEDASLFQPLVYGGSIQTLGNVVLVTFVIILKIYFI